MAYPPLQVIGKRISINQKIVNKCFPLTKAKDRSRFFLHSESWVDSNQKKWGQAPFSALYFKGV